MTNEIRHRRKLPPIERMLRRIRDRWRKLYSSTSCDWFDALAFFVIGVIVTGLVFFTVEMLRRVGR